MKILAVRMAKVIWLFDTQLINPNGLAIRDLFRAIKERYQFAKSPAHEYDYSGPDAKYLVFEGGVFSSAVGNVSVSFTVYNDGIVAQTLSDTDHTRAFLQDLRGFAAESGFAIPSPETVRVGFVSIFDIETTAKLITINPQLEAVVDFIQAKFSSLDGRPRVFELAQIGIWSEDLSQNLAPVAFKFERRIEHRFEANRYWTQAPLQTKDHIELLNLLQSMIS